MKSYDKNRECCLDEKRLTTVPDAAHLVLAHVHLCLAVFRNFWGVAQNDRLYSVLVRQMVGEVINADLEQIVASHIIGLRQHLLLPIPQKIGEISVAEKVLSLSLHGWSLGPL